MALTQIPGTSNKQNDAQVTSLKQPPGSRYASNDNGLRGRDDALDESQNDQKLVDQTADMGEAEHHDPDRDQGNREEEKNDIFAQYYHEKTQCRFLWADGHLIAISSFNLSNVDKFIKIREQIETAFAKAVEFEKNHFGTEDLVYEKAKVGRKPDLWDFVGFFPPHEQPKNDDQKTQEPIQASDKTEDSKAQSNSKNEKILPELDSLSYTSVLIAYSAENSNPDKFIMNMLRTSSEPGEPRLFTRWLKLLCACDSDFSKEISEHRGTTEESNHWHKYKKLRAEFSDFQEKYGGRSNFQQCQLDSFIKNKKGDLKNIIKGDKS